MSKSIKNLVQYKRLEELVELEGNPRTIAKDHPAPEWQCHDW